MVLFRGPPPQLPAAVLQQVGNRCIPVHVGSREEARQCDQQYYLAFNSGAVGTSGAFSWRRQGSATACASLPPQFSAAFLQQLNSALQRQSQVIGERIGMPELQLEQEYSTSERAARPLDGGTGRLLWAAGVKLAAYLCNELRGDLRGARVLELGCGTGQLAGMRHSRPPL